VIEDAKEFSLEKLLPTEQLSYGARVSLAPHLNCFQVVADYASQGESKK